MAMRLSSDFKIRMLDGLREDRRVTQKDGRHWAKYDRIEIVAHGAKFYFKGELVGEIPISPSVDTRGGDTVTLCGLRGKVEISVN